MYPVRTYLFHKSAIFAVFTFAVFGFSQEEYSGLEVKTLQPLSQPRGTTMFTKLDSKDTGIEMTNEYLDPRMWSDRYQEFALGAIGTGVTVGDYDNDGRPDVFIVNKTGHSKLFRNLGDWRFQDVTEIAGLGPAEGGLLDSVSSWFGSDEEPESVEIWKQGATFADVDNDGDVDLYLCRFEVPNQLFLNQGDGTFAEAENANGLDLTSASGMASFADFDRDGWLDVFVQTNMLDSANSPDGSRDRLYHNNGDGMFTDISDEAGITGLTLGHSATWWDYNQDGWPDLYIANDFATPDRLYRNNGDKGFPTFTDVLESLVPHQPFSSMGADIGDINNDGLIDFFVADMAPTTHEMNQRGMAVTRYAMREEIKDPSATPQYMYNALYLNNGTEHMREAAWMFGIAQTDWTWSTRFEDLDNDGFLDLHVTNGMSREYQNHDLRQRILRTVQPNARLAIMKASPVMNEANLAYRNQNGERFERIEKEWGLGEVGVSFGTAFADFDNDGDLDLIYSNLDAPPSVFRNDSQTGNRAIFELRGSQSNYFGIGATIEIKTVSGTQVRQLVLSRGYLSTSEPSLHFGLGDNKNIESATVHWPSGATQTLENLPANHRFVVNEPAELVSPSVVPKKKSIFELVAVPQEPSSKQQEQTKFPIGEIVLEKWAHPLVYKMLPDGSRKEIGESLGFDSAGFGLWRCLVSGDFNGDGKPDFALGNQGLNTHYQASSEAPAVLFEGNFGGRNKIQRIEAYYENGRLFPRRSRKELIEIIPPLQRRFPSTNQFASSTIDKILPPAALNGATKLIADQLESGALISQNDGSYSFQAFPRIAQIAPIRDFGVADFDGDGILDLVVAQNDFDVEASISRYDGGIGQLLLGNGDGTFRAIDPAASGIVIPGNTTSIVVQDFDQDGSPDFVAIREGQPRLAFRNLSGTVLSE